MRDYFYDPHHRPVNDLSRAVKLTNRLLRSGLAEGLFTTKESSVRLSHLVPIPYCYIMSWFAIALAEIRSRRILREKVDCMQSMYKTKGLIDSSMTYQIKLEIM